MNYHNDKWIMEKVLEHFQEAKTIIPEQHIVLTALQGSQNYGLDYVDSDVDTKCITTPTFKEIALARKPLSTTHVRENNEHIDLKDIRLYTQTFRKQNLNFLEILWTPYFVTNGYYSHIWFKLVSNRERIARYYPYRAIKSMKGVALEKFHALKHPYPSKVDIIQKYGYDGKQLSHLLRVEDFIAKYVCGAPYGECLVSQRPDLLIELKEQGAVDLPTAEAMAASSLATIEALCDEFEKSIDRDWYDKEIDALFDEVSYEIMKISVEMEL